MKRSIILLSGLLFIGACGSTPPPRPEPFGNWDEDVHVSVINPNEDCDRGDLESGRGDCGDEYYEEAYGHLGIKTKKAYGDKYGWLPEVKEPEVKVKKPSKTSSSTSPPKKPRSSSSPKPKSTKSS